MRSTPRSPTLPVPCAPENHQQLPTWSAAQFEEGRSKLKSAVVVNAAGSIASIAEPGKWFDNSRHGDACLFTNVSVGRVGEIERHGSIGQLDRVAAIGEERIVVYGSKPRHLMGAVPHLVVLTKEISELDQGQKKQDQERHEQGELDDSNPLPAYHSLATCSFLQLTPTANPGYSSYRPQREIGYGIFPPTVCRPLPCIKVAD